MSRLLAMVECRIAPAMRQDYLAGIGARTVDAASSGAHFWVFEHAADSGRFLEFTEAGSEEALRSASEEGASAGVWREVKGA